MRPDSPGSDPNSVPDPIRVPDPNGVYPDPFGRLLSSGIYTRLVDVALGADLSAAQTFHNTVSDTARRMTHEAAEERARQKEDIAP